MAIQKNIKMKNGITLGYHRISMIKIDVNQQITVSVESYVDEEARLYEKDYAKGFIEGEPIFPYIDNQYMHMEYVKGLYLLNGDLLQNMYDWLKERSGFEGSTDI